jgi:hypothetical protein
MTGDVAFGGADVAAHQQFGQFAVTVGDGIENPVVLGKGLAWPIGRGGELDAVHAHQLIQLAAEHLGQGAVAAALNDPVVEVEVAFLLVVADAGLKRRVALMGFEHLAQFVDVFDAHALGGQAAGHAFEGLADFVEFDQLGMAERHHSRADMRHAHQQALAFQAVDRLAQRPAADAVGARQLRLGDLAAGAISPLTMAAWMRRKTFSRVSESSWAPRGIELIQHIVDTLKAMRQKLANQAS